ncbi:hypothetical protein PM076_14870 [Halorubrum ezzemoulense]|uniref:hypothetical protein n=1 Tax=Halorubrum ezzemoulense TaxID=337243 RepID=UPI00232E1C5B|nr:hypothetical protein [Halorubrum ezzemoulense]MDB2245239.1 hypothetical protein [Halorubrum ezzemoulense]MDB2290095.1 hypothetical protein [Halorubrum ezzemoulense]MDB2297565.1 hypothetical protein [Halorubrum ezzemoulense]MDB2301145.1 hypothetical protein [Halorubrum ezzemoulense]
MKGFVSPVLEESEADPVQIGDSLGVYRQDDDEGHVHLRTADGDIDLGFHDISVSRLRPDGAPIQFFQEDDEVFVRNVDNASDVEVNYLRSTDVLEKGDYAKIRGDCIVEPGIHTDLLVTLESTDDGSIPVLIKSRCRTLEISARSSDHETIMHGESLLNTLEKHPIDVEQYDELVGDLRHELDSLRSSEDLRRDGTLGEEGRQKIERLTNNIIDIYDLHA